MSKFPLAAVTMVYNENFFLPLWLKYYTGQVGPQNCYVLDHGSDDGTTNVTNHEYIRLKLPRTEHNDGDRAKLVGQFCETLLKMYERVIYVDVDEFIVPEPRFFTGLLEYCEVQNPGVTTMFGFDLVHDFDAESKIDVTRNILEQRRWIRPSGFNCKPSLINRPVTWWNGFHGYDGGNQFDNIYLFHLANIDLDIIVERQSKRNKSAPTDGGGSHHSWLPAKMVKNVRKTYLNLPRYRDSDLITGDARREAFLDTLFDTDRPRHEQRMKNHANNAGLWLLPDRFRSCF